jgi:arylsulfatase A-like enzyme
LSIKQAGPIQPLAGKDDRSAGRRRRASMARAGILLTAALAVLLAGCGSPAEVPGPAESPEPAGSAVRGSAAAPKPVKAPRVVDTSNPPNVLLISVDTLRADHLGIYGYPRPTSPTIDGLGNSGVVFEKALTTAPWTLPSHVSLLTGLYPAFHGVQDDGTKLAAEVPTLAEAFKGLGYHTLAVVSHVYVSSEFGLDRGFDSFDDSLIAGGAKNPIAEVVVDHFLDAMSEVPEGRFFAFVHLFDPHWSYTAPEPFFKRFAEPSYRGPIDGSIEALTPFFPPNQAMQPADLRQAIDLYDGEIAYTDAQIARLLEELRNRGRLENTVILFTADHGEEFKEHGQLGHGKTLFHEMMRIPLVVTGHPVFPPGTRRRDVVSLIDVAPTLLHLAGGEAMPGVQGMSLVEERPTEEIVFGESLRFGMDMRMAYMGNDKLIHHLVGDQRAYFDLATDPGERRRMKEDPTRGTLTSALADFTAVADRGWHMKLISWNAPVTCRATVRTEGRLVNPRKYFWNLGRYPTSQYAQFSSYELSEDGKTLSFEVKVSQLHGQVVFDTEPRSVPVSFEIEVIGGEPGSGVFLSNGERMAGGEATTLRRTDPRLTSLPRRARDSAAGVHIRAVNPPVASDLPELSKEALERLKALGYLGSESDGKN